jgi:hypothetical protein
MPQVALAGLLVCYSWVVRNYALVDDSPACFADGSALCSRCLGASRVAAEKEIRAGNTGGTESRQKDRPRNRPLSEFAAGFERRKQSVGDICSGDASGSQSASNISSVSLFSTY